MTRLPMSLLTDYPLLKAIQELSRKKKVAVYLVGGFVRDQVLGRACHDFDFAVAKDAVAFARLFARRIKGAFVLLDPENGCGRVAKKTGRDVTTFDFADFRAATLEKDLQHRDFTINTLAVRLDTLNDQDELRDVILDPKQGLRDLKSRRIRMVSVKAFREDPLRLLRAYSLRATLDFSVEHTTLRQVRKDRDLIVRAAAERVRDELFKILQSPRAAGNIRAMDKMGLLEKIIPQIAVMYGVPQGGYHHLDVWPHSLETLAQLEKVFKEFDRDAEISRYLDEVLGGTRTRRALLKLAALLHDIGKPETRKKEVNRISFHAHEQVGKRIVRTIARALKLSTRERMSLEDVVHRHLRPGYLSNFKSPSEKAVFRYFRDTKEEAASVALLSLADQRSTRGPLTTEEDQRHHEKICRHLVDRYFQKKKEKPFVRLITGDTLIKELRLQPSPLFGKILSQVEEAQAVGKVKTKEDAVDLAKSIVKRAA